MCGLPLTFLTSRHVAAPSEIPLAHEDLGAYQLISRVALVGDDGAVDEVRVGCALPAVGDLRQLRAGVVPRHLCWCWSSWCRIVLVGESREEKQSGKWKMNNNREDSGSTELLKCSILLYDAYLIFISCTGPRL